MFKNKKFSLLLSGTVLCALSAAFASVASAAPEPATFMRDVQPAFRTDEIPVIRKDSPLFNYSTEGAIEQIKMTGIYNERSFRFYSAKNELISKASVTLRYTPSPALIPQQSQLNVYLNGQLQKSLPITKDQLGNQVSATVDLNAKRFDSSNRLTLEFVGQYTQICGSPANPALWLTVDSSSYLSLNTQKPSVRPHRRCRWFLLLRPTITSKKQPPCSLLGLVCAPSGAELNFRSTTTNSRPSRTMSLLLPMTVVPTS